MYDSNYPSNKKRGAYFQDTTYLPTAEKSQYRSQTSQFLQSTPNKEYQSPSKNGNRISSAKRSINEVIEMVSAKKLSNRQALEEVRALNQEIASSIGSFHGSKSKQLEQRNRTADNTNRDDYSRDFVATSQFEWRPSSQEEELKQSQKESVLSQENLDLRSRLNEEIKKNNELLKHVKALQAENASLRSSNIAPNINTSALLEENRQLRSQLNLAQSGSYSGNIDLIQELNRLKQQNGLLRRDTIALLKQKQGY